MTRDSLPCLELLYHAGRDDFLKSLAERVLEQLMEFEVRNRIGADQHERAEGRATYRNGYRERPLHTRLGTLDLRVPVLMEQNDLPQHTKLDRGSAEMDRLPAP